MCKKRWFFFTFDPPLYTQQQTLLLTVSGNKTSAEKISTKERLCKPHFRKEAKYRRKPLQTSLQQRSLCNPQSRSSCKPQQRRRRVQKDMQNLRTERST
jgi:hypothetical protein